MHGGLAQLFVAIVRVFAHNDRIINHDAKRDDQPEQRDHIDRDPPRIHQRNRRGHRRRYARGHPKGRTRIQKEEQQPHHQCEPHQPVINQQVQPPGDRLRPRADQLYRHALGQHHSHIRRDAFDAMLDTDGIPPVRAVNTHRDRGIIPHEIPYLAVGALLDHPCHVPDQQ